MNSKNKIILSLILVIIVLLTIGLYFEISRDKLKITDNSDIQTLPKSTDIKNPIEYFYKNFSAKDYKVRTITANNNEGNTFYYKKGAIIRVDNEGKYNTQKSSIIKNNKFYSIDNEKKTFTELGIDDKKSAYLLSMYKIASILDPIMQGETPSATPWSQATKKSDDENLLEYETSGRNFISYAPGASYLVDVRLILDSKTGLITSISIKSAENSNWITTNFTYEEESNIESFLSFPADYKKVDPI